LYREALDPIVKVMASKPIFTSQLDRLAVALSGLCAVHCVATAFFLAILASAGGLFGQPIIHEVGLILAMVIGALALGGGYKEHGFILPVAVGLVGLATMGYALTLHETGYEPAVTIVGVAILALGHRLNLMARQ